MNTAIVILVTHLLGIGHLVRARLLADSLAEAGFETTLISGGRPPGAGGPETTWRLVQLRPLHIEGTAFSDLRDEDNQPTTAALLAARREHVVRIIREVAPVCLVTEHFPFGRRQLAAEFEAAIEAASALPKPARIVASIRDVLVAPQRPDRLDDVNAKVNRLFDVVLVHGDPAILPLGASWPGSDVIAHKLRYTGYVMAGPAGFPVSPALGRTGEILVSGGGSAAALPLFAAAIGAGLADTRHWRILVGQSVDAVEFAALRAMAAPAGPRLIVERARPDFPVLLAGCAVSVSMAGYNTMLDLAQARVPAIVVPFDAGHETEQACRAAAWAKAGLVSVLPSSRLSPTELRLAVDEAAARSPSSLALRLDGAAESARIIRTLIDTP
jgi:predicted glycosyltransferase